MLYEDLTTGAVIVGRLLLFENDNLTGSGAEAVEETLKKLNKKHRVDVTMFVPGDSATDHVDHRDEPLYTSGLLFGVFAVMGNPWEGPIKVSQQSLKSAREVASRVPAAFWEELAERSAFAEGFETDSPQTYLSCWGPLPQAVLCVGVPHPSDDRDGTVYDFKSVQDMDQEWMEMGVDGLTIDYVEFSEVAKVDLSPAAVAQWVEKANKLKNPELYMTLRYD